MFTDGGRLFAHMSWIGGATDAGKSTVAKKLAERHGLQVYHYDRHDQAHLEQLGRSKPEYSRFLAASLDERWVYPEPQELFQRALQTAQDRFPLVIEDLAALPYPPGIVVEGFGLLPELLASLPVHPRQAVWLIPSEDFKRASLERRGKPSFKALVSDPERAVTNILNRDRLLAAHLRAQVLKFRGEWFEVDGSHSADEMVALLEGHFARFLTIETGKNFITN